MHGSSGGQKGPLSDPRHGKARGDVIKGGGGAGRLHQIGFVVLVVAGALALLVVAGTLLGTDPNSSQTWRYVAYLVLAAIALILLFRMVTRRRSRQSLDETLRSRRRP